MNSSETEMEKKIAALERKVDRMERVIRLFVEHPFIWQEHSYHALLAEMGYTVELDEKGVPIRLHRPALSQTIGEK